MIGEIRRRVAVELGPLELKVDVTAEKKEGASVTITNGIASKLIYANSNQSNRGFWNSITNGKAYIFDVTKYIGKKITITYWNRANTRRYIFVPNSNVIPSSDPGATEWPNLYINAGSKAASTTSYTAKTATVTVPAAVTAAGNQCDKVHLIVSGYINSSDPTANIVPKVIVN